MARFTVTLLALVALALVASAAAAPVLVSTAPEGSDVSLDSRIVISYDEEIAPGISGLVEVVSATDNTALPSIIEAENLSFSGNDLIIDFTLLTGFFYDVIVPEGAVVSAADNSTAEAVSFSFDTRDQTPVTVTSVSVADGATVQPFQDLIFTFSSPISLFGGQLPETDLLAAIVGGSEEGVFAIEVNNTDDNVIVDGNTLTISGVFQMEAGYTVNLVAGRIFNGNNALLTLDEEFTTSFTIAVGGPNDQTVSSSTGTACVSFD